METHKLLTQFFSKSKENEINNKMMFYSYNFEYDVVLEYVKNLINTPLKEYLFYLLSNYHVPFLEANDVLQYSNFDDCTINICKVFKEAGDKGFSALEAGKLLENDGIERKDGAYTKYGENHCKTATSLGILNCLSNKYFLSCIGFVLNDLNEYEQKLLISRLILRNNLIKRLVYKSLKNGSASYEFETGFLSDSTRNRRKSNVKKLITILQNSDEISLKTILNTIEF